MLEAITSFRRRRTDGSDLSGRLAPSPTDSWVADNGLANDRYPRHGWPIGSCHRRESSSSDHHLASHRKSRHRSLPRLLMDRPFEPRARNENPPVGAKPRRAQSRLAARTLPGSLLYQLPPRLTRVLPEPDQWDCWPSQRIGPVPIRRPLRQVSAISKAPNGLAFVG